MSEPDTSNDQVFYEPVTWHFPRGVEFQGQVAIDGASVLQDDLLASGEMVPPDRRLAFGSSVTGTLVASQVLSLHYFTAKKTEPITKIETYSGGTAAGATPTLCQKAVFEIDAAGKGTRLALTANNTALWSVINTAYLEALTTTFNKVRGQRYAIGLLIVTAAAVPILQGVPISATAPPDTVFAMAPRISGRISAQATMPTEFLDAAITANRHQFAARLVP